MHFDELLSRYDTGERNFGSVRCWGQLVGGDLQGIDLSGATLQAVSLREANLAGAILREANITRSNLIGINLVDADLSRANFCREPDYPHVLMSSHLSYANLERANLAEAYLQKVPLVESNLRNANLQGANLSQADLRGADLTGANLTSANLAGANLCQANLTNAVLTDIALQDAILGWTILPDGTIANSPAMDLIANKLKHLKRKAWKPVTTRSDTSLTASKFAGRPWLSADETYPLCPQCHTPLRFFLQLNLNELPEEMRGKFGNGLLQLFYCTNEEALCEGSWEPFAPCKLVRIVQPVGTPANVEMPHVNWQRGAALIVGEFPPKQIVGWREMDDYPEWEDAELLQGIRCNETEFQVILNSANIGEDEIEDFSYLRTPEDIERNQRDQRSWVISSFMDTTRMRPPEGDKLAGHPHWVQNVEYPNCPVCDRLMDQLIFEFASDDNVPYLWGDVGTGYILQCPDHKNQVTLTWQCG